MLRVKVSFIFKSSSRTFTAKVLTSIYAPSFGISYFLRISMMGYFLSVTQEAIFHSRRSYMIWFVITGMSSFSINTKSCTNRFYELIGILWKSIILSYYIATDLQKYLNASSLSARESSTPRRSSPMTNSLLFSWPCLKLPYELNQISRSPLDLTRPPQWMSRSIYLR